MKRNFIVKKELAGRLGGSVRTIDNWMGGVSPSSVVFAGLEKEPHNNTHRGWYVFNDAIHKMIGPFKTPTAAKRSYPLHP